LTPQIAIINAKAKAEAITVHPKPARSFSPAPPVNTGLCDCVAVGIVVFFGTVVVLVLVLDAGLVGTVFVVLCVAVVDTLVEPEVAVVKDVAVEVEEAELDDFSPLQKPFTQVLYAHCASVVQFDWKFPHSGIRNEFTA
jgi:hypothetical protein